MCIKKTSPRGFSLLELLLVMTLAPIVFFAVYSNFSTGVRLWQRLEVETPEEDQALFLTKARRDFENMMRYASVEFEGSSDEVTFASGIQADSALGGERAIGEVRYFYDARARGIARQVKDVSEIHEEKEGKKSLLLTGVGSLGISYFVFEPSTSKYEWKDAFLPEKPGDLPMAVRLSYSLDEGAGSVEQTFFVPSGGTLS